MKNNKLILLFSSIVLLFAIVAVGFYREMTTQMGLKTVSEAEYRALTESRTEGRVPCEISLNGVALPLIEPAGEYLIPQKMDAEEWNGSFTHTGGCEVRLLSDGVSRRDKIEGNEPLTMILYDENFYEIRNVRLSGLPIVYVTGEELGTEGMRGDFLLLSVEDGGKTPVLNAERYACEFRLRGASSTFWPKKSYRVSLMTGNGKKKDEALLGMREDEDWILNPMYSDITNMKEKLSLDIWNALSASYQHSAEYVELVLDGSYEGLYCLQEPVDYKTFRAGPGDSVLYSVKNWEMASEERTLFRDDVPYQEYRDEFVIEKADKVDSEQAMELLRQLVSDFEGNARASDISLIYDRESCVNYSLFVNLVYARDNTYKNEKILASQVNPGEFRITKAPWDLDWTFGYGLEGENTYGSSELLRDEFLPSSIKDSDEFKEEIRARYLVFSEEMYTEENLLELVDGYETFLRRSGAAEREEMRWSYQMDTEGLKTYVKERVSCLNTYYGSEDGIQK